MKRLMASVQWIFMAVLFWIPETKAKASLDGHFYLDDCFFPSDRAISLDLNKLDTKEDYSLQLESNAYLLSGQQNCKPPTGILYHFTFTIKKTSQTFKFSEFSANNRSDVKKDVKGPLACRLDGNQPIKVMRGYAFLSCRDLDDKENITEAVRKWQKDISLEEEEARHHKNVLLGSVAGCVILLISVCAICIVIRIKATEKAPANRMTRRRASTPLRSQQTRVTNDKNSSSHPLSS